MLFILCESSLKLFNPQQQANPTSSSKKNTVEIDAELYNNMLLKMYDLHKRTQHLELVEWKRTHDNWFKNLFNISTAYETIDEMFEIKHDANIDDFGNLLLNYYNISTTSICSKYKYVVRSDCVAGHYRGCSNVNGCYGWTPEICGKVENFTDYNEAVKVYSTYPNQILNGERIIRKDMKRFNMFCVEETNVENYYENNAVCLKDVIIEQFIERDDTILRANNKTYCIESKPINETNIIGYINYKHAYNTNDEQWLINQIQQLINDNKHLYFEDYVNLFREKYYRITDDDERLYKLIRQEMKQFKAKNKKVKVW